jgi:hypothetical protein
LSLYCPLSFLEICKKFKELIGKVDKVLGGDSLRGRGREQQLEAEQTSKYTSYLG